MNTSSLHIKVEPNLKKQAQQIADDLGLSLSAIMKALLKQFVRTKQLSISLPESPSEYLIQSLERSEKDIRAGRVISFKTGQKTLAYLDQKIKDEKNKEPSH